MEDSTLKSRAALSEIVSKINADLGFSEMHLELASDARANELIDFLIENFYPDETICKSLGIIIDNTNRPLLLKRYSQNLSLLLISDETNEIIGCRTIVISSVSEMDELLKTMELIPDEKIRTAQKFLHHKDDEMDIFKHFGVNIAVRFINLCTHNNYRGKGLGCKLMEAALRFVGQMGLNHPSIAGEATSNVSQKIYEKFHFELLHELRYADYKVNGEAVFKNTGKNTTCNIYVKEL